ncbi:PilZ domain-containing protein [Allohahella marinimesophila]
MNDFPNNRRNFFRVRTMAQIEYHAVRSDRDDELSVRPVYYELLTELQKIDVECQRALASLHELPEVNRQIVSLFKLQSRKIDLIARTLALTEDKLDEQRLTEISLSEGGMAFQVGNMQQPGDRLAVKATFLPGYTTMIVHVEIIDVQHEEDGYWVRTAFLDLDEAQRQLIARHILRMQQNERRRYYEDTAEPVITPLDRHHMFRDDDLLG